MSKLNLLKWAIFCGYNPINDGFINLDFYISLYAI